MLSSWGRISIREEEADEKAGQQQEVCKVERKVCQFSDFNTFQAEEIKKFDDEEQ